MAVQGPPTMKELQQRVTMFHAGDELYSGAWLADFQRSGHMAWQTCIEVLQKGPLPSCDGELLQAFSAQTLARLARAFVSWHKDCGAQKAAKESLETLIVIHARGQSLVWKQLALALACAELWLGTWAPAALLLADSLPEIVRRELLVLPAELLFDHKALPLTSRHLREAAASSFFRACESVFAFLLAGVVDGVAEEQRCQIAMRVLGAWLRAVRKSSVWLPGVDAAAPLRSLASQLQQLLSAARQAPAEAAEVAQQLARWRSAPKEAAELLKPLLGCIFSSTHGNQSSSDMDEGNVCYDRAVDDCSPSWLLPLLSDLAADFWPRAALGEIDLDWEAIALQAVAVLSAASGDALALDAVDAEAAIGVWQTLAETIQTAVRASESLQSSNTDAALFYVPSPEKRVRRSQEQWQLPRERLMQTSSLQKLFELFALKLLEYMRLPLVPEDEEALAALQIARASAECALVHWSSMVSEPSAWSLELRAPLSGVELALAEFCLSESDCMSEELARQIEVVFWFFGAVSSSAAEGQPGFAAATAIASSAIAVIVPHLAALDAAQPPWRALLWSAACVLATAVNVSPSSQPGSSPVLLEWMLQRPPSEAGAPNFLELTELPYARAVEAACQRLPTGTAHTLVGERLFLLTFASWTPACAQERSLEAQALLLSALRHAMGSNPELLCQSLAAKVLPGLCTAVDRETATSSSGSWMSPGGNDQDSAPWPASRLLFETLTALLPVGNPSSDADHPAVRMWRQAWHYLEAALLRCPIDSASEQPIKAASQALREAALRAPALLPEVVQLLAQSAAQRESPEAPLLALREIAVGVPCPPVDPLRAAEVLDAAVAAAAEALLQKTQALVETPGELAALFGLLAEAVRPSPPGTAGGGPCEDRLRPLLIARRVLIGRCLSLVSLALPECRSELATKHMMRFAARLMSAEEAQPAAHGEMLSVTLAPLCAAVCRALAAQDFLAEPEAVAEAGELLLVAAVAFPIELPAALTAGLGQVDLPDHSKELLQQHMACRAEWSQKGHWLEQLQQIALEWQSERRFNLL
ncbi:unnamed protein product [Polarella glacialis]|uniref:Exportin-1/Importin-beta-like domain-containing protein n=1 Tax=Polarella glacialis TaxID=89957 RepID=A0A813LJF1_POLGL|nr:unnamed protein product [Polarella glacialis]